MRLGELGESEDGLGGTSVLSFFAYTNFRMTNQQFTKQSLLTSPSLMSNSTDTYIQPKAFYYTPEKNVYPTSVLDTPSLFRIVAQRAY